MSNLLKINTKKYSIVTDGKTVAIEIPAVSIEESLKIYSEVSKFLKNLEKKGVLR